MFCGQISRHNRNVLRIISGKSLIRSLIQTKLLEAYFFGYANVSENDFKLLVVEVRQTHNSSIMRVVTDLNNLNFNLKRMFFKRTLFVKKLPLFISLFFYLLFKNQLYIFNSSYTLIFSISFGRKLRGFFTLYIDKYALNNLHNSPSMPFFLRKKAINIQSIVFLHYIRVFKKCSERYHFSNS